jgi:hypothetical protein
MRILFYPDRPQRKHKAWHACRALGWEVINEPRRDYDAAWLWLDETWIPEDQVIRSLRAGTKPCINVGCDDISKSRVERVFSAVFGYSSIVDPLIHEGAMVSKPEQNDRKDELELVTGPLAANQVKPGTVYQKLVDTTLEDGRIEDTRVCVFDRQPRFVIFKRRHETQRFETDAGDSELVEDLSTVLNDEEVRRIRQFCTEMGLDYGELDVLRDRDGTPYIVDCNKTPGTGMIYSGEQTGDARRSHAYEEAFRHMFGGLDRKISVRTKHWLRAWRRTGRRRA